ncbi:glycosyltransferase family 2 protein [Bacillus alkalicellulosilyticus]|uniref:glycosyltransferase family 2 protein n=1 Tax=Alkalihalobacterium alkalicellulosilyticum TaxID=1912214 RepID=UPI00099858DF|nr:glycosyltransferase family 2 protein [Bacillus alkalicellulosilyticus]
MEVSIIVPFYNNVDWLYEAINSIEEKEDLHFEILIIDDGSKEKIDIKSMSKHKDRIRYLRQPNQGPGKARNYGIDEARGEYIAFLDSDDLYTKDKLLIQLEFMRKSQLEWSHTSYMKFYPDREDDLVNNENFYGDIFPKCFAFNPIATPTVMVRRTALENPKKRFSEKMRYGQDGFLWCQLASFYQVGIIKEPLSKVRMRGGNATMKAKNHLYVKSNMYKYILEEKKYFGGSKIPLFIKIIFYLSHVSYTIVDGILAKVIKNQGLEYISRLLYAPQYLMLKLYSKF